MTVRVPFGSGIGLDIVRSRHSSSAGGSIGEALERRQDEGAQRLTGDGQLRRLAFRRDEIPGGLLPFFDRRLCSSEERRVGNECVSPLNSRWSLYPTQKKNNTKK